MDAVSIHEAKTHFSRLVARAEAGEEIVVRRGPKPVAKIVAYQPPTTARVPGVLKGQITIADDFDETREVGLGFVDGDGVHAESVEDLVRLVHTVLVDVLLDCALGRAMHSVAHSCSVLVVPIVSPPEE